MTLLPEARYDEVMRAFGGQGFLVRSVEELHSALQASLSYWEGPSLINVLIDPASDRKQQVRPSARKTFCYQGSAEDRGYNCNCKQNNPIINRIILLLQLYPHGFKCVYIINRLLIYTHLKPWLTYVSTPVEIVRGVATSVILCGASPYIDGSPIDVFHICEWGGLFYS